MHNDNIKIVEHSLRVHPDSLIMFSQSHFTNYTPYRNHKSLYNLQSNFNHNNLSPQAKRKMSKSIKYLLYTASEKKAYNNKTKSNFTFKINMLTLTLSSQQVHSDQVIKSKLLNQLLVELKTRYHLKNYVWKSECQRNGNIHFHILSDIFVPWNELQNLWNRIQNKLNYVNNATYSIGVKHPNSTDIHSLRKINNIVAYCTKYMLKDSKQNRVQVSRSAFPALLVKSKFHKSVTKNVLPFLRSLANKGRIWGCSFELSNLTGGSGELDNDLLNEISRLQKEPESKRIDKDNYSLVLFNDKILQSGKYPLLEHLLNSFIAGHFGHFQQKLILNEYRPPS
jgi:hypothetical protein